MSYKVKNLGAWHLRSAKSSIVSVVEELKTLNLESSVEAYLNAQNNMRANKKQILTFQRAGEVTRLLIPLIGRPSGYILTDYPPAKANPDVFKVTWKALSLQRAVDISNLLEEKKFSFSLSSKGVLEMLFPGDTPPSCFFTSEDPEVWKKKQAQKSISRQVTKVAKKLDRK